MIKAPSLALAVALGYGVPAAPAAAATINVTFDSIATANTSNNIISSAFTDNGVNVSASGNVRSYGTNRPSAFGESAIWWYPSSSPVELSLPGGGSFSLVSILAAGAYGGASEVFTPAVMTATYGDGLTVTVTQALDGIDGFQLVDLFGIFPDEMTKLTFYGDGYQIGNIGLKTIDANVPAPATLSLMLVGLGLLVAAARRPAAAPAPEIGGPIASA